MTQKFSHWIVRLGALVCLFLLATMPLSGRRGAANDAVRVGGGLISGTTADGVRSYKGIPYAAPPVGDLRWKPPQQPVGAWNGVRSGEAVGPACPQVPRPPNSVSSDPVERQSEDCLYLNVWTAAKAGEKRPVMVWYHGGGWSRGSATNLSPNGAPLAKKGVVLVTVNSRLGALGYLAHPELTAESPHHSSGNYGFLDQIAALQWVQKNIAAFGGDPTRVTIFGQSAGSWTISMLMATPLAKGLFHRAIGESGGRFGPQPYLTEDRNGVASAEKLGLAFVKAAGADSIKALRAMPAEKLLVVPGFRTEENVDGWALPDEVRTIFAERKHNDVPVVVGSTANESSAGELPKTLKEYRARVESQYGDSIKEFDAAYPVQNESDIRNALSAIAGQTRFNLHMRTWARMTTAAGRSKAYMYYFSHVPPHPRSQELGAFHTAEIPYVFNDLAQHNTWAYQDVDHRLADLMSSYWVNFAATGDPNGKGAPTWAPYDLTREPYLEFGEAVVLRNHLLKPQLDFLERLQRRGSTSN